MMDGALEIADVKRIEADALKIIREAAIAELYHKISIEEQGIRIDRLLQDDRRMKERFDRIENLRFALDMVQRGELKL